MTIEFTRPVTHNLDLSSLEAAFSIIITGPRAEYKLTWFLEEEEFERETFKTELTF